jgi:hypothetical protein
MSENPQDAARLRDIEQLLTEHTTSPEPLLNDLVGLRPSARPSFQQGLEDMLVAQRATQTTPTKEKPTMFTPSEKRKNSIPRPASWAGFGLVAVLSMILGGLLALAAIGRVPIMSSADPCTPDPTWQGRYIVQKDETLGAIADRFSLSVPSLSVANCITNPNLIQAGTVLRIPPLANPLTLPTMPTPVPMQPSPLPLEALPTFPSQGLLPPTVPPSAVELVLAKQAIPLGTPITLDMLQLIFTAEPAFPNSAALVDIVGKYALLPIESGQVIFTEMLTAENPLAASANCGIAPCPTDVRLELPSGMVALTVPLNLITTTSADLLPQSHVTIASQVIVFVNEAGTPQLQTAPTTNATTDYAQVVLPAQILTNNFHTQLVVAVTPQDAIFLQWMIEMGLPLQVTPNTAIGTAAVAEALVEVSIPAELVTATDAFGLGDTLYIGTPQLIIGTISYRATLQAMPMSAGNPPMRPRKITHYVVLLPATEATQLQKLIEQGVEFTLTTIATDAAAALIEISIPAARVTSAEGLALGLARNEPISILATGNDVTRSVVSRRAQLVAIPTPDDPARYVVRLPHNEAAYLQELLASGTARLSLELYTTLNLRATDFIIQGNGVVEGATVQLRAADPTLNLAIDGEAVVFDLRTDGSIELQLPLYEADYLKAFIIQGQQVVLAGR